MAVLTLCKYFPLPSDTFSIPQLLILQLSKHSLRARIGRELKAGTIHDRSISDYTALTTRGQCTVVGDPCSILPGSSFSLAVSGGSIPFQRQLADRISDQCWWLLWLLWLVAMLIELRRLHLDGSPPTTRRAAWPAARILNAYLIN